MHPAVAAAAEAAAAARAVMTMRAAARANIILGLTLAAMALVAATVDPGGFHGQTIEDGAPAPAATEAPQCAATEAEALGLRGMALPLVLTGLAQAVVAAAADVASLGSLRVVGRCLTAAAHLVGALNVCALCFVVSRLAVVAVGHCSSSDFFGDLVVAYVFVAASYATLLGVSVAVAFC